MAEQLENTPQIQWFLRVGAILILLGLISGLTTALMANPRMGLSAHLEGVLNGLLLIALASAWPAVRLSLALKRMAFILLTSGSIANWVATQLAAVWGTSSFTPIISGKMVGTAAHELIVGGLLVLVGLTMIVGVSLTIIGLFRSVSDHRGPAA